ncbi:rRNA adenine N-6-methyltransferase family protein [Candidatus Nanosalina sp. VS9-1]|uniref:rRNA adenine N-6-methyltransferase family protein n=1 Tax=Candidatus Nanosalina sp. VS9-1 TaxID=3388566 RepID=UPI0039E019C9
MIELDTTERLQELGIKPVGGQHFLDSEIGLETFLEQLDTAGKTVLEIGAGTGNITERIEAEKIFAVEKDTVLAEGLEEELDCEVINEDFLEMEIPDGVEYLTGNLPFEISSDILEKAGKAQLPSVFIVQEEFADKVVASPGDPDYNFFSFKINYYFVPVKAGVIASGNYYPEPEVSTAILKLFPNKERHGVEDDEALLDFAKALYTHKGKKLRNAFVDARHMLDISKDDAKDLRDKLPNSEKRVNELEVFEMAEALEEFRSKNN